MLHDPHCIAIGLAPAFKMRFWNVGAEGQMLVGGIATAFWMINFAGKMNIVMLFLCMAISAIVAAASGASSPASSRPSGTRTRRCSR